MRRTMINQKHLDETQTLKTFLKRGFWGFKNSTLNYLCLRFEARPYRLIGQLHEAQKLFIIRAFHKIVPPTGFVKEQFILNIIFKDLLQTYQGWRHFKGYPVRGQRRWSNAWTCFRSNKVLQDYKAGIIKRYYGRGFTGDIRISGMAEHINSLWRAQWLKEWKYSREFVRRQFKRNKRVFTLDLLATSLGLLGTLRKDNPKVGKKKKKLLTGSVGFDTGFTKVYTRYQAKMSKKRKRKR